MKLPFPLPLMLLVGHVWAALLLLWIASLGRRQHDRPTCAGCGTDLRPMAAGEPTSCPGCGAYLSKARSVRFAKRKRSRALLGLAVAMLVTTPLWPTVFWDWMRPKPTVFAAVTSVRMNYPPPRGWDQIAQEARAGMTRTAATGYLARAKTEILEGRTKEDSHWWNGDLFRAVSAMLEKGHLSREEAGSVLGAMVEGQVELVLQPAIRENRPIPARMHFWGLKPDGAVYACRLVAFNNREQRWPTQRKERSKTAPFGGRFPFVDELEMVHSLAPGEYDMHLESILELEAGGARFEWPVRFPVKLRISPADSPAVELVDDPELTQRIMQAARVEEFYVTPGIYQRFLNASWQFETGPDAPVYYFDVRVSLGAREFHAGWLSNPPPPSHKTWSGRCPLPAKKGPGGFPVHGGEELPADVRTVTVRLIPNPEKAENLFGADKLPAEPIVLKDVPLRRYDLQEEFGEGK